MLVLKSTELSEYSYIGLADFLCFFFQEKLKICSRSFLVFRCLTCDFFSSSVHFIFKMKANSTIKQQKLNGDEKRDRLLISKMEVNY